MRAWSWIVSQLIFGGWLVRRFVAGDCVLRVGLREVGDCRRELGGFDADGPGGRAPGRCPPGAFNAADRNDAIS